MSDIAFAKLKRLKINRYRNIKPGTELRFADGTNVLLGKNGSGKTTLLNLLSMVVSGNFYPIRREEFALEFELSYARSDTDRPATWSVVIENKRSSARKRSEREDPLSCSFSVTHKGRDSFHVTVGDSKLTLTFDSRLALKEHPYDSTQYGPLNEFGYHFINDLATLPINPPLLFPALPQRIQRLDEARDWLRAQIFSDEPLATLTRVHDSDRAVLMNYTDIQALPSDLLEQFQSDFHNNTNPVTISLKANKQTPSLQGIVSTLGYIDGQALFERQSSSQTESTYGYPHFHFVMRDGTSIRLQDLSFGEQRLFAYHYYLACSPQVVIADELTNGMHHQMVRSCIEAIGQRQAFLATQNPLLLDHLEFTSLESVQESFTLCSRALIDGEERMTFRQMSDEEAREFFGHYGAEQEHINEILRCLGLW